MACPLFTPLIHGRFLIDDTAQVRMLDDLLPWDLEPGTQVSARKKDTGRWRLATVVEPVTEVDDRSLQPIAYLVRAENDEEFVAPAVHIQPVVEGTTTPASGVEESRIAREGVVTSRGRHASRLQRGGLGSAPEDVHPKRARSGAPSSGGRKRARADAPPDRAASADPAPVPRTARRGRVAPVEDDDSGSHHCSTKAC